MRSATLLDRSFLRMIRLYKRVVSPLLPSACRFQPTCSQYAYEAIDRYGARQGLSLAVRRLIRCTPLSAAGYDPVPELGAATTSQPGAGNVSRETNRPMGANPASKEA
jgi:putative membrane protein insertion efficiency factor